MNRYALEIAIEIGYNMGEAGESFTCSDDALAVIAKAIESFSPNEDVVKNIQNEAAEVYARLKDDGLIEK